MPGVVLSAGTAVPLVKPEVIPHEIQVVLAHQDSVDVLVNARLPDPVGGRLRASSGIGIA